MAAALPEAGLGTRNKTKRSVEGIVKLNMDATLTMRQPHEILMKLLYKEFEKELSEDIDKKVELAEGCKSFGEYNENKKKEFNKWLVENDFAISG